MTKAIAQTYSIIHEHRLRLTYSLLAGCLFMVILYAANVYAIISRTVALQKISNQTTALENSVNGLDASYLTLSSKITPDSLAAYSMSQGHVSEYISRSTSLSRIAMGGHEL